jgi:transposase-like protein
MCRVLEAEYGAKYPKAVASLTRDQENLLTFFDFPAEHWIHIRTSNHRGIRLYLPDQRAHADTRNAART